MIFISLFILPLNIFLTHEKAKYKRFSVLVGLMTCFNTATAFIGNEDSCGIDATIELKTNNELFQIAEHTQNSLLMFHVIINQMYVHCYFREYLPVADLAEKYQMSTRAKRVLDFYFVFFEGICKWFC